MKFKQQGFNLIEAMVAAVVLAVGLLGVAGLQLTGVRANQGSYFRSQASAIAMDMMERIHNNRPGADVGGYAQFVSGACGGVPNPICAAENGAGAGTCTGAQMAAYDRYVVACGVRGAGAARVGAITQVLPTGLITVNCLDGAGASVAAANCQPGFRHRVDVSWTETTASSATAGEVQDQVQTVSTTFQP